MQEEKKKNKKKSYIAKASTAENSSRSVSALQAFFVHLICGLGLAIALWVAHNFYAINLVSDPSRTLRLIWIVQSPIVTLLYSWFRLDPERCSYLKAVGRGMLALPAGALVNALGAIVLGAPVGIEYLPKTINWSVLMSLCTFVPAASVFGSSWSHWQRMFAHTKPNEPLEYMICIPAHGAVIGAWLGAWPMPLDWERPWQEWPVCVTYGAMTGYLVAMVVSLGFVVVHGRRQNLKRD
ncbi:uncharacterized protein C1450.15 [Manihot esculenta]|uniref:Phosphatidylinositol-glycan biosynthesis class F protein n=1 Tax=Manihot esculenta TaxID=3983 RepID=A0A2C9UZ23_MANES|nr:uncharacterized protein C1450.15 [Manihot esculenta]OAY37026.1 hypothetical protein MANES_11G069000v8 [Manihot esculenta]